MFTSEELRKIVNEAKPENVVISDIVLWGTRKTYIKNGIVKLILFPSEYNDGIPVTCLEYEIMIWNTPENNSREVFRIEGVSYEKELFPILEKKNEERLKDTEEFIREIFGV